MTPMPSMISRISTKIHANTDAISVKNSCLKSQLYSTAFIGSLDSPNTSKTKIYTIWLKRKSYVFWECAMSHAIWTDQYNVCRSTPNQKILSSIMTPLKIRVASIQSTRMKKYSIWLLISFLVNWPTMHVTIDLFSSTFQQIAHQLGRVIGNERQEQASRRAEVT